MAKATKYEIAQGRAMYVRTAEILVRGMPDAIGVRIRVDASDFAEQFFMETSPQFKRVFLARLASLEASKVNDLRELIRGTA